MSQIVVCDNLLRVLETTGERLICFTRVGNAGTLAVCVTDGIRVWKSNVEKDIPRMFQQQSAAAAVSATGQGNLSTADDSVFLKFRNSFLDGNVTALNGEEKLRLKICINELVTMDLELPEATVTEKNEELQFVLLRLADRTFDVEKKLLAAEKKIESLESQQRAAAAAINVGKNVFDMTSDVKRKKTQGSKVAPKTTGMSVINPGCKKRTKPKGVEFD